VVTKVCEVWKENMRRVACSAVGVPMPSSNGFQALPATSTSSSADLLQELCKILGKVSIPLICHPLVYFKTSSRERLSIEEEGKQSREKKTWTQIQNISRRRGWFCGRKMSLRCVRQRGWKPATFLLLGLTFLTVLLIPTHAKVSVSK
jgi:hypothetical protein